ncbi:hypothetical protein [Schumannella soli]|uniref:Uncharacterized protein n=1 Tax=Schumannella soli TaxID=2590779 RepID=A0A506Y5X8_9MICO|nr:hypothetical protein [Schumannella soli]TPW78066.1 hypothetical protein FJ657_05415 [Schumannella soli]
MNRSIQSEQTPASRKVPSLARWLGRVLVARGVLAPKEIEAHLHDRFVDVPRRLDAFLRLERSVQRQVLAHLQLRVEARRSGFTSAVVATVGTAVLTLVVVASSWITALFNMTFSALLHFSDPKTGEFTAGAEGLADTVPEFSWLYLAVVVVGGIGLLTVFVGARGVDRERAVAAAWLYAYDGALVAEAKKRWWRRRG